MPRLALLASILLLAGLAALTPVAAHADDDEKSTRSDQTDWVLIYVMSYDNNLEKCGPVILQGLARGVAGPKTKVIVLSDDTKKTGLVRWVLTHEGQTQETLETDDIASPEVIEDYLGWVGREHPAKNYGIVFLNHGGDLDSMCLDEYRGERMRPGWLPAHKVGPVLRRFRESAPGKVPFLFLQQCGRGSIDNLYNFHDAADAIVASQLVVGAPNTYYTEVTRWLEKNPEATGAELAQKVMHTDQHFTNYVLVDGAKLAELPKQVDRVVKPLLKKGEGDEGLTAPTGLKPCFGGWGRGSETNFDAIKWFEAAYAQNGLEGRAARPLERFTEWLRDDLIIELRTHPRKTAETSELTGLSVWVPMNQRIRKRYQGYPLHADSKIRELWGVMYEGAGPAPSSAPSGSKGKSKRQAHSRD